MKESMERRCKQVVERGKDFFHDRIHLTTTQMIIFGFLVGIFIGTILLMLPISSADGQWTSGLDALFTATTSICVTGLTTVSTFEHWSFFGKIVIIFLIQFGGLGVVTFTTTILLVLRKRITLKERLLIQDAYNLDTLRGLVKLTKKIMKGTFLIEGIGAIMYAVVFVPEFGVRGIGIAIFNSVSAFCNAGMDVIGNASLAPYRDNIIINVVTMSLIILGGIGFPVWWDIVRLVRERIQKKMSMTQLWRKVELHTKIVLSMTIILIVAGTVLIMLLEHDNPATLGNLSWGQKWLASLFQSVTTRTAGFLTIPQENFTDASSFVCIILMFIGGSPSGTAGGIKTVTIAVIILSVFSSVKGKQDVEVFKRKVTDSFVRKSIAVFGISFLVLLTATIALAVVEELPFMDILYEATSAIGTVGLSRSITPRLSSIGKLIIIVSMYLGRIGPISLALAFNTHKKEKTNARRLPTDKILVG